jgi:hypothetical protein
MLLSRTGMVCWALLLVYIVYTITVVEVIS